MSKHELWISGKFMIQSLWACDCQVHCLVFHILYSTIVIKVSFFDKVLCTINNMHKYSSFVDNHSKVIAFRSFGIICGKVIYSPCFRYILMITSICANAQMMKCVLCPITHAVKGTTAMLMLGHCPAKGIPAIKMLGHYLQSTRC